MDYKIIDDSNPTYLVVEYKDEHVTLHPSTRDARIIKDDICTLKDSHWTLKKDSHAIRCRCKKCCKSFNKLMNVMIKSEATIIDSSKFKQ